MLFLWLSAAYCTHTVAPVKGTEALLWIPDGALEAREPLSLTGPWEFYWDRLIMPVEFRGGSAPIPDRLMETMKPWNDPWSVGGTFGPLGRATYRLRLRAAKPIGPVRISFLHQMSAWRLYANGVLLSESGKIGNGPADHIPGRVDGLVFLEPGVPDLELVFQIGNYHNPRGGMRGSLILGAPAAVSRYLQQRQALEMVALGIILGAVIYHLFFYLMHRSEPSFLLFSILCFVLAMRIPFQGQKLYTLFTDPVSWEAQIRILSLTNFGTPALALAFLRALFPGVVSWRSVAPYAGLAGLTSVVYFWGLLEIASTILIFTLIVYPVMALHVGRIIFRAQKGGFESVLMALGLGGLLILSLVAYIQNHRGHDGGYYGLAPALFFVIFQALALGRLFAGGMRARAELAESQQASSAALVQQRQDLQTHLHDSLGGALTDLQIHAERQLQKPPSEMHATLRGILDRIQATTQMFRSQLLFLEDLTLAAEDLLAGIQMTLLRRYADAGREIDFDCTDEAASLVSRASTRTLSIRQRMDLFYLMVELGTNDLKYGYGESVWRISAGEGKLRIRQSNCRHPGPLERPVPLSAAHRVEKFGGNLHVEHTIDEYIVMIELRPGRPEESRYRNS